MAAVMPLGLKPSPEEEEALQKEHREQLLARDYMPAFRTPRPAEYDRFRSKHTERSSNPYCLPPKRSLESSYLSSYRGSHLIDMDTRISAVNATTRILAARPSSSKLELVPAKSSLVSGNEENEDEEARPIDASATYRGLAYLPTPPKTTSKQFFKRRTSEVPAARWERGHITDDFSNHTMAIRWQHAAQAREPLLAQLGYPFDKGFVVLVHRENCTAFVDVAPGMTPKQLMNRMRNEPPPGKPFNNLRMGQYLGIPCPARLVRGPYVLDENKPLSAQHVGQNCKLALVYLEERGTFDLIDTTLAEEQRAQAKQKTKHFSRREEHKWGWIGQPDPQVVAQSWFQELLEEQKRVSGHNALLHAASGLGLLHLTQGAAVKPVKKKKKKKQKKKKKT